MDELAPEARYALEPADDFSPDKLLERRGRLKADSKGEFSTRL